MRAEVTFISGETQVRGDRPENALVEVRLLVRPSEVSDINRGLGHMVGSASIERLAKIFADAEKTTREAFRAFRTQERD